LSPNSSQKSIKVMTQNDGVGDNHVSLRG
jgi:hypothetical protein